MQDSHNFGEQETGEKTLSEKILGLTSEQRTNLSINAPYCCDAAGNLTLVYVVFGETGKPGLLEEAVKWSAPSSHQKAVIPPPIPEGVSGFWDPAQRIFRSRYIQPLAFGKTAYASKEVTSKLGLRVMSVNFCKKGRRALPF